jgi:S-formylglutathione hydrolase FrmB
MLSGRKVEQVFMRFAFAAWALIALGASPALAQPAADVTVEQITIHSPALEGNLEGNSPDRSVTVYLPPSYSRERNRRYPVVYGLHGYTINNEIWAREIRANETLGGAFAAGAPEMIVVLPSAQTLHNGSMYSSSITIGDWESFIARDLVAYIDAHYRTIADRDSRGLVGHSMGGYGAIRIGLKRPDVFGALYIMSPCCMSARGAPPADLLTRLEAVQSREEATTLGFLERATLAVAAAWSPNPNKPPLFLDLPVGDESARTGVLAQWAANAPLAMVEQYVFNLRKYNGIAIDVGDQDGLRVDAAELHRMLNDSQVRNTFEIYAGDHVSGVADRFQNFVIPFFGRQLSFEQPVH